MVLLFMLIDTINDWLWEGFYPILSFYSAWLSL